MVPLLVAALDASSIIMYMFQGIYNLGAPWSWTLIAYGCCGTMATAVGPFIFGSAQSIEDTANNARLQGKPPICPLSGDSKKSYFTRSLPVLRTEHFYFYSFWTAAMVMNKYFYIGNLNNIFEWTTDGNGDQVKMSTRTWDVCLPHCSGH